MTNENAETGQAGATVRLNSAAQPVTPSQQAVRKTEVTITDARGRLIKLKQPKVLQEFNLMLGLGPVAAANTTYVSMVMPLLYVESIDGDPVHSSNKLQIDAAIQQLDRDGLDAIAEGINTHFGRGNAAAEREAIKKS